MRAGMARAAARGVHVGRPTVLAGHETWPMVRRRIESGEIGRREAARLLGGRPLCAGYLLLARSPAPALRATQFGALRAHPAVGPADGTPTTGPTAARLVVQ